jgi:hypothetical protein
MDDWKYSMIVILFNVHREKEFHKNGIKIYDIMQMKVFSFVCVFVSKLILPVMLCEWVSEWVTWSFFQREGHGDTPGLTQ